MDIAVSTLIRPDHPSNDKQGGVGVCFQSFLPLQMLRFSVLYECINLERRIDDKLCNFICLYRSPSQSIEEFETFVKNLTLILELTFTKDPHMALVVSDFNAKLQN